MLLFRVSFTGELGFEINVPADFGLAVWEAVHHQGRAHGITEYGTETMHVLRAEKGYIIIGQDTDGTVTPDDAGLSWAVGKNKSDFVGKRSLDRGSMKSADRKQLVGLRTKDPRTVIEEGAQVAAKARQRPPMELIGHVTSSYASSVLEHSIALAMIAGGRARLGQPVCAHARRRHRSRSHHARVLRSGGSTHQCLITRRAVSRPCRQRRG
jgi:sarcosine oxidase subunit alpha